MNSVELDMHRTAYAEREGREAAIEELRRSRQYLAEAQKLTHTGSWAWSPLSGSLLYWSEECFRILGFDPARGLPSFDATVERIHPEDRPETLAKIERYAQAGKDFEIEYRLLLPDGVVRNVRIFAHPVRNASGTVVEFIGTVVDITEQKRAEEERRENRLEARLQATLNMVPAYTYYAAPNGALTFVNERCADYLGLPKDHPLRFGIETGAPWDAHIPLLHPDDQDESRALWATLVATGAAGEKTFRVRNAQGIYRWFLSRAEPLRASDGTLLYWVGVNLDIEELKQAEEERREHLWFLESMDRVNRAMQRTNDFELMMSGVVQETLAIFGCDRAWLVYPCDPDSPTIRAVMEHTSPEYPGAFALGEELPVDAQAAEDLRRVLEAPGAVTDLIVSPEIRARFSIESMIAIAVRPKGDRPYLFGLHQCSHARAWTAAERRLFEEIARRLEDALTSVLAHRNLVASQEALQVSSRDLQESKAKLEEAQRLTHVGYWEVDIATGRVNWSDETYRIYGMQPQERPMDMAAVEAKIHPDDWRRATEAAFRGGPFEVECRLYRPTGEVRVAHFQGETRRDASGTPYQIFGTIQDITERKRAEEERREHLWFLESMERINRAMQRTNDVELMMSGVVQETLAIFGSDRAYMVYPCDPDSPTVRAVMEHTSSEYPRAFAMGEEVPVDAQGTEALRRILAGPGAVTNPAVSPKSRDRFSIKSTIAIAVRPKGDRPYLFALHQCSHARDWNAAERRLFEEIARRLEDALTSVLAHRKLLQREAEVRRLVDANIVGIVFWDLDGGIRDANDAFLRMTGYERADLASVRLRWTDLTPAEWRERDERAVAELNSNGSFLPFEKEYFRKDGSRVSVFIGGALFQEGGTEGVAFVLDLSEQKRAQEALRSSEAYLAEAQTLSQTGSWAWSPDQDIRYWSEECYRVLSFDPRDGLPRFEQFFQRIHPDDQPGFRELTQAATREKAEWKADYRIVHPGGAVRNIHVVGHPVLNTSGDLVEFVGTVIDVTEPKRAEEDLRASEQRFRTFVDQATDAFFLYDDKHIVRDVNRRACETMGYTRDELIGMHVSQLNPDVTPEMLESQWGRLLERGTVTHTGLRRRKDGSVFPVELRARVFSRGGRFFAIASAIDITERRRREQCVLAQHRVTQVLSEAATLEQARSGVLHALCRALECDFGVAWCVDAEARVLKCVDTWSPSSASRPAFEAATRAATFGPGVELPGRAWSRGAPVCVRDIAADPSSSRAELAASEGFHAAFTFPIALKSGITGVIELFSREVRDADPELLQMMMTVGSQAGQFVERSRAEDALRGAHSELAHVTRVMSMGELTASIAHEVNQPLGAMVTSAASASRWLAAKPPNLEKAWLALARIAADGERASKVIDRMRMLVKRQGPGRQPVDVNETIGSVVTLMRDELERAGVAHAVRLADDLPRVLGDRVLLQQVILNLILNAIDAMRGIEDRARVLRIESRLGDAGEVWVQVRDTGSGLPPDARLFQAFYTTKERGLGMGLSISRSIVEEHGGRMQARPNEPHGALFEFSLPVTQP